MLGEEGWRSNTEVLYRVPFASVNVTVSAENFVGSHLGRGTYKNSYLESRNIQTVPVQRDLARHS